MEQDFVKAHEHPSKNRYPDRLPCMLVFSIPYCSYIRVYNYTDVEFMPCLKPIEIEDSYINASFIDVSKRFKSGTLTLA